MTLKEVWAKLGKPAKFVALVRDMDNLYTKKDVSCFYSNNYTLPSLTLAECHEWAKEVQGGDGFPFKAINNFGYKRLLKDEHDVVHYAVASSWTYVCMAEGDEEIEIDQDGFTTEYPIDSAPAPKELNCPCSGWDLLRGHLPECPYSNKED